jgi:hypothetical protein
VGRSQSPPTPHRHRRPRPSRPRSQPHGELQLGQCPAPVLSRKAPLCTIARWKSPRDPGDTRFANTDSPPAD